MSRLVSSSALLSDGLSILEKLIAFDTTSRNSNLALIHWIEDYLAGHGVESHVSVMHMGTRPIFMQQLVHRSQVGSYYPAIATWYR